MQRSSVTRTTGQWSASTRVRHRWSDISAAICSAGMHWQLCTRCCPPLLPSLDLALPPDSTHSAARPPASHELPLQASC